MRRLKPATGLWKIQAQWVVKSGKQQQLFLLQAESAINVVSLPEGHCRKDGKIQVKQTVVLSLMMPSKSHPTI